MFSQTLNFTGKEQQNRRFVPPLGNLGLTHRVYLWLDGTRIVDFLLTIKNFPHIYACVIDYEPNCIIHNSAAYN